MAEFYGVYIVHEFVGGNDGSSVICQTGCEMLRK